jgi:hypothetical protein
MIEDNARKEQTDGMSGYSEPERKKHDHSFSEFRNLILKQNFSNPS